MVAEIAAGVAFNSMALLADGWHMASHAGALGITAFAYAYARKHADNPRFTFGAGKVSSLGGFASAVVLGVVAVIMVWESISRLFAPVPISYNAAMAVAALGLLVNLASAWILGDHGHSHDRAHAHDHNIRAAYLHVLADALTSVLAIVALLLGQLFGWGRLDPLMGVVGAIIIGRWSLGLIRETSQVLLDQTEDEQLLASVRAAVEGCEGCQVTDLHLWRIGPGRLAAIIALRTDDPKSPDHYKSLLAHIPGLAHVSVEVNQD